MIYYNMTELARALMNTAGINEYGPSRLKVQMDVDNLRKRIQNGERATFKKEQPYEAKIIQHLSEEQLKKKINEGAAAFKRAVQNQYNDLKLSVYDNTPDQQELYLQEARKQVELQKILLDPAKVAMLEKTDPVGLRFMQNEAELEREKINTLKQKNKLYELARGSTKQAQSDEIANQQKVKRKIEEGEEEEEEEEDAETIRIKTVTEIMTDLKELKKQMETDIETLESLDPTNPANAVRIEYYTKKLEENTKNMDKLREELNEKASPAEVQAFTDSVTFNQLPSSMGITSSNRPVINGRVSSKKELTDLMDKLGFKYKKSDSTQDIVKSYNTQYESIKQRIITHKFVDPDQAMAIEWANQWRLEHPELTKEEAEALGYQIVNTATHIANQPLYIAGGRPVYLDNVRPKTAKQYEKLLKQVDYTRPLSLAEIEEAAEKAKKEKEEKESLDKFMKASRLQSAVDNAFKSSRLEQLQTIGYRYVLTKRGKQKKIDADGNPVIEPTYHIENGITIPRFGQKSFFIPDTDRSHKVKLPGTQQEDTRYSVLRMPEFLDKYNASQANRDRMAAAVDREGKLAIVKNILDEYRRPAREEFSRKYNLGQQYKSFNDGKRMTEFGHGFTPLHKFPKEVISQSLQKAMNSHMFKSVNKNQYNSDFHNNLIKNATDNARGGNIFGSFLSGLTEPFRVVSSVVPGPWSVVAKAADALNVPRVMDVIKS